MTGGSNAARGLNVPIPRFGTVGPAITVVWLLGVQVVAEVAAGDPEDVI